MSYHWTFLLLQKHLTSGTELILIGWKIVSNEEHVQCDHGFASQPLAHEPLHSSQLFDTSLQKACGTTSLYSYSRATAQLHSLRTNFLNTKCLGWHTVSRVTNTQAINIMELGVSASAVFVEEWSMENTSSQQHRSARASVAVKLSFTQIHCAFSWISVCFVFFL